MTRALAIVASVVAVGCPVAVPAPQALTFACARDADCHSGFLCVEGVCRRAQTDITDAAHANLDATSGDIAEQDRGPVDAVCDRSSTLDAASVDAASVDAAAADAQPDAVSTPDSGPRDLPIGDAGPLDSAALAGDTGAPPYDAAALADSASPADSAPSLDGASASDGAQPSDSAVAADAAVDDSWQPDIAAPDTSAPDAGVPNFYDLQWTTPSEVSETVDLNRCETDPILSPDEQWLYLSRPEISNDNCYSGRRFHLFAWNSGAPTHVGMVPKFDVDADENNAHIVDGVHGGQPGRLLMVHTASLDLRSGWLEGDPPDTPWGAPIPLDTLNTAAIESSPTLNAEGDRMIFVRDQDIYETTGLPPDGWSNPVRLDTLSSADRETDPALSADGRVLVFIRTISGDDLDLFVARRTEVDQPFAAPVRLPNGPGQINTQYAEMDAFISSSGDLIYVSARGDGSTRRVYIAPGFVP